MLPGLPRKTLRPFSSLRDMAGKIRITYCTQCRWLLRATWVAQELLTTFPDEIAELTLKPGKGGVFVVEADGDVVFSRKQAGRHAGMRELKQLLRDRIAPGKSLGHSDKKENTEGKGPPDGK